MSYKKIIGVTTSGLIIGYLTVLGTSYFGGDNSSVHADSEQINVTSTGLYERTDSEAPVELLSDSIDFIEDIESPDTLPIDVDGIYDEIIDIVPDESSDDVFLTTHYVDEEANSAIIISSTDAEVIPSDEDIITLNTGTGDIQYLDTENAQFLFLTKDGLYYEIEARKNFDLPDEKFTEDELIEIVEGL